MISSGDIPCSVMITIWLTRMRVPEMRGAPPQVSGVATTWLITVSWERLMIKFYHGASMAANAIYGVAGNSGQLVPPDINRRTTSASK